MWKFVGVQTNKWRIVVTDAVTETKYDKLMRICTFRHIFLNSLQWLAYVKDVPSISD